MYSFFAIEGNCSWIVVLPRDCTTTTEAGFEPDVNEKFEIDHRDKHNLHECTIHNQGRESICLTCSRIRTTLWPLADRHEYNQQLDCDRQPNHNSPPTSTILAVTIQ